MTTTPDEVMLPADLLAKLRAKVDGERFKSEADVIHESLIALEQREESFESWLQEVVYPAQDDIKAHPEKARSGEQVRARIAEELQILRSRP
ncbi:type II toxin-antitoxin system ParD family antitoxin [Pseudoxanthobacter sp. M-2]|uniref:type II toxin-antitoxin system ParD family antitoxin n=1 Tax=Pseudoxanthobacter sp. M-2 TaxID=3078754 RepID=UPI0038FC4AE3